MIQIHWTKAGNQEPPLATNMASLMRGGGGRHLHSLVHQMSQHQHGQADQGRGSASSQSCTPGGEGPRSLPPPPDQVQRGSSAATIALAMRGSPPVNPGQLALEEKAKEEFLLGKEGPRGRWRRGMCWEGSESPRRGSTFFPSRISMCVLLSQISLSLSRVKVKFGLALFCFVQ